MRTSVLPDVFSIRRHRSALFRVRQGTLVAYYVTVFRVTSFR